MTISECVLAEQDHKFISSQKWEVAVLPFGACEAHGYHLPYGTDNLEGDIVGRKICERAYQKGAKVLLLPTMPFGVNTSQLKIPGGLALSVTPTTLLKVLTDLVDALERQGIRKLVLLNSHGGNELKPLVRELYHRTSVFICVCDWYKVASDQYSKIFKNPGDHADEMETSFGLAFFPELVKMAQAGTGAQNAPRIEALRKGWVSFTRPWHLASVDTGMGDPRAGTAEKGRQLMAILEDRLGDFLCELAKTPLDDKFPF